LDGEAHATLTISGIEGTFAVRKNAETLQELARVTLELLAPSSLYPPYSRRFLELPNFPVVDGAVPRSWNYPFNVEWDGSTLSVTLSMSSMAFRSVNHDNPLPHLGEQEELTMAAPHQELSLRATAAAPRAEASIVARFMLRDFPELGFSRRPI
jgi:hypothetical protein